jgi:hypothetical protein
VAETDGTPRYRKSKPPKGGGSSRNSRPNAKPRNKRALRSTLQTGAAQQGQEDNQETSPTAQAPSAPQEPKREVVQKTMPTVIRTDDASAAALADTYADVRDPHPRSTAPLHGSKPAQPSTHSTRPPRGPLGSTLRMELAVPKADGSEPRVAGPRITAPRINVRTSSDDDAHSPIVDGPHDSHDSDSPPGHGGFATLQDGSKRSRKPTTPGFAPAFPDPSARPSRLQPGKHLEDEAYARFDTLRRGSDVEPSLRTSQTAGAAPSLSSTGDHSQRPRRPRRPGERTLIMKPRAKKSGKRDWVFVVLLVAALGLTASMFLSQQTPAEEVVDASAYDDPDSQGEEQDPFAPTTLRPWKDKDAPQAAPAAHMAKAQAEHSQSDTNALTARDANAAAANSVQATELRSQPSGAEVIAGNAVVGSTPVRVARGTSDMVYELKLRGHTSKTVRVGPQSPATIAVELEPLAAQPQPTAAPAAQ